MDKDHLFTKGKELRFFFAAGYFHLWKNLSQRRSPLYGGLLEMISGFYILFRSNSSILDVPDFEGCGRIGGARHSCYQDCVNTILYQRNCSARVSNAFT